MTPSQTREEVGGARMSSFEGEVFPDETLPWQVGPKMTWLRQTSALRLQLPTPTDGPDCEAHQLGVTTLHTSAGCFKNHAIPVRCTIMWSTIAMHGTHQGGVDCQLATPKEGQPVHHNLQAATVCGNDVVARRLPGASDVTFELMLTFPFPSVLKKIIILLPAKDQSRIHQFRKKVLPGLFLGYALYAGGIWKGDVLAADLEELETMDASEIHSKRTNTKEEMENSFFQSQMDESLEEIRN